jgi:hypothetical protein
MSETIETTPAASEAGNGAGLILAGGAALAAATLLLPRAARAVTPALTFNDIPGTGDIKVLNYALALEALEADLYRQSLGRLTGGYSYVNAAGTTVNVAGLGLAASEPDVRYVQDFGNVEAQHRDFLNSALGANSILAGALQNARFDFGITSATTRQEIVQTLYTIENLGTQAYLGAIKFFATKTFLLQAGSIQATEARHTAVIAAVFNTLFGPTLKTAPLAGDTATINGQSNTAGIDSTAEPDAVLAAASPFIVL